ncbi:AAA-domain-containing protein, partial [Tuber magnatum]
MLTCMDDLASEKTGGKPVVVIGATNRPDSLDPALRRAGRFDREICLNVPDEIGREKILRVLCEKLRLSGDFDFKKLAKSTPGFVGADLSALAAEAGAVAMRRMYGALKIPPTAIKAPEATIVTQLGDSANIGMDQVGPPPLSASVPVPVTPASGSLSLIQRFLKAYPDRLTEKQLDSLYITLPDFLTALPKIQPSSKREGFATVPDVTWADIGALESLKVEMRMAVVQPIKTPELYESVGITAPAGVLLWGPPGCGKTLLAKAVANESRANFISIQGPELLNKYVGESERAVRQVFSRARASIPCVIFFDELDALAPRRSDSLSESSHRVVNTLLTELDGLNDRKGIYVIGTTNRPNAIDPAILRPGRFDNPFFVDLPNTEERVEILKTLTKKTPLSDVDLGAVAEDNRCKNFSGADLAALVRKAAILALRRSCFTDVAEVEEGKNASGSQVIVTAEDFEKAFTNVRPSVLEDDREQYRELATRFDWVLGEIKAFHLCLLKKEIDNSSTFPMGTVFKLIMGNAFTGHILEKAGPSDAKRGWRSFQERLPTNAQAQHRRQDLITPECPKVVRQPPQNDSREPPKNISLMDIGGIEDVIEDLLQLIAMPLVHPETYLHTGVQPPRGVLLHGPPGCGKTMLANAIAGEIGLPFIAISAPSIVSGMSGESEKKLRELFEEAREKAPCLIFMDEIDAITPKRESTQREMERRIVAQMLTCMDDLASEKTGGKPVVVIGATNRPDSLDPALRRAGRFDREICLNVPDEIGREKILRVLCEKLRLSGDFDFKKLAKSTPGFVGADLSALAAEA